SSSELCCASLCFLWLVVVITTLPVVQPPFSSKISLNNPGDVYYVYPSDGPTSIVVKPVLTHSNYQAWARSMKR
ncbi:hypothetical protein L195_g058939, partial [Trifolium pratense]